MCDFVEIPQSLTPFYAYATINNTTVRGFGFAIVLIWFLSSRWSG